LFEGFARLLFAAATGAQNNSPVGRAKLRGTIRCGPAVER